MMIILSILLIGVIIGGGFAIFINHRIIGLLVGLLFAYTAYLTTESHLLVSLFLFGISLGVLIYDLFYRDKND